MDSGVYHNKIMKKIAPEDKGYPIYAIWVAVNFTIFGLSV